MYSDAYVDGAYAAAQDAIPEGEDTCPHGLSAWLCADPFNHYPPNL